MLIDREYLVEIDARDASGATVTLRFSRDGYMTARSDTPADTVYHPRIADPGTLALYLWGAGTTGGSSEVGWGSIILRNQDSGLDYLLTDGYGLAGVAVRIKIGAPTAALAAFTTIFSGTIEAVEFDADGTVRMAVRDLQHLLSVSPLQSNLYAGSNEPPNGLEGLARDLKGKGKPRLYGGRARNFAPALVNAQRLIYQVSDRPVASVDAVYEGGAMMTAGAEMTFAALTGDISTATFSTNFTSASVSIAADTIVLTGAVFNPGDPVTFTHGTFNPFPSPIALKSGPGQQYQSATYIGTGRASCRIFTSLANAETDTRIDLTNQGTSGIAFSAAYAGYTFSFVSTAVDVSANTINLGPPDILAPSKKSIIFSFPSSTAILPAPLDKATTYYLSGTAATAKLHLSAADAIAGINPVNLTSAGISGVTFTARVTTSGTEFETWTDFRNTGVNTTADEITCSSAHGITTGDSVVVRKKFAAGNLPAPLLASAYYYARAVSTTIVTLHTSKAGALANTGRVNITDQGSSTPTNWSWNQISRTYVLPGTYRWASDATGGCVIRLGTKPVKAITVDATAQASAANQTTAQALKAIALDAGIDAGAIESADVTALDAAAPQPVAEYLPTGDTRSARSVMDVVAASVGAWYAFDATGRLRMGRLIAPSGTPALTLTEDSIFEVQRTQAGDDGSGVPTWRCTVRYAPSIVVQTTDQLVGSVTDDQAGFVSRELREVASEDETVLDVHPGAPERMFDTRLLTEADAADEATRRQSLYGTRRDLLRVRVPLTAAVAGAPLGGVVSITWPKLGLAAGRSTLLIGMETEWARDQAWLLLWG